MKNSYIFQKPKEFSEKNGTALHFANISSIGLTEEDSWMFISALHSI